MDRVVLFANPIIVMLIGFCVYLWSKKSLIDLSKLGCYISMIGALYFMAALFIYIIYKTLGC